MPAKKIVYTDADQYHWVDETTTEDKVQQTKRFNLVIAAVPALQITFVGHHPPRTYIKELDTDERLLPIETPAQLESALSEAVFRRTGRRLHHGGLNILCKPLWKALGDS